MPEQTRIPGGARFGPLKVDHEFAVPAGANNVMFLIARDERVRKTGAKLPQAPEKDVRIELYVSQAPAQGNAQVEIHPVLATDRGLFGGGTVLLDWRRNLKEVEKTRNKVEEEWMQKGGLPFPSHQPTEGHWALWVGLDILDRIRRFLQVKLITKAPTNEYRHCVNELYHAFRARQNPSFMRTVQCRDDGKYRAIGSDGYPPEALDDHLRRHLQGYGHDRVATDLYWAMLEKLDHDFELVNQLDCLVDSVKELHRRLMLTAAWCYAAAPESFVTYFRNGLNGGDPCNWGHATEQTSRVLSCREDMRLYFREARKTLFDGRQLNVGGQMRWIKGTAQILSYRQDAPLAMSYQQARTFALAAAEAINQELDQENISPDTFYWSVMLLLLVLRYRRKDCSFLNKDSQHASDVRNLERLLEAAQKAALRRNRQAADFIAETLQYLHFRGTQTDIIKKLAAKAGD